MFIFFLFPRAGLKERLGTRTYAQIMAALNYSQFPVRNFKFSWSYIGLYQELISPTLGKQVTGILYSDSCKRKKKERGTKKFFSETYLNKCTILSLY